MNTQYFSHSLCLNVGFYVRFGLRVLAAVKKIWGERVTTVFPKQGHYAHDPEILSEFPPADIELARLKDLITYDLSAFLENRASSRA